MSFTWPGGTAQISAGLARILERSEQIGAHSVWPMDHFFQIPVAGAVDEPMLEAYSVLSWAAAKTSHLQLGALVTGVHHRHPGVLVKTATTLDVLSGGRAWLGLGAGWNEEESRGLGIPLPSMRERFERLEETLQIAHRMFDGASAPFDGRHYALERPLNSPPPLRRPPIMVGGSGERKTLRLVAQYADACNVFAFGDYSVLAHKLEVLQGHCADVGRPYADIARTVMARLPASVDGSVEQLGRLAELGVDLTLVAPPLPDDDEGFDRLAAVIGQVAALGRGTPEPLRRGVPR